MASTSTCETLPPAHPCEVVAQPHVIPPTRCETARPHVESGVHLASPSTCVKEAEWGSCLQARPHVEGWGLLHVEDWECGVPFASPSTKRGASCTGVGVGFLGWGCRAGGSLSLLQFDCLMAKWVGHTGLLVSRLRLDSDPQHTVAGEWT